MFHYGLNLAALVVELSHLIDFLILSVVTDVFAFGHVAEFLLHSFNLLFLLVLFSKVDLFVDV